MIETATQPAAEQPWRLDICPECGYALEGLPDVGKCPECGNLYDRSHVILHGWGRGEHVNLMTAKWTHLTLLLLVYMWWIWDRLSSTRFAPLGMWDLFWVGLILPGMCLMLVMRWSNLRPGLVRVELRDTGCRQVANASMTDSPYVTAFTLLRWFFAPCYFLAWGAVLCASRERSSAMLLLSLGSLALLVVVVLLLYYRKRTTVASGSEAPTAVAVAVIAWPSIGEVAITPASPGFHRIRLRLVKPAWRIANDPVDAEVRCTSEQADQLRSLIQTWRDRANDRGAPSIGNAMSSP